MNTGCPFFKEVVMALCDACACKKPLPVNRLVPSGVCGQGDFTHCPIFVEAMARLRQATDDGREGPTKEKERP
jgi:hypothetical protein